MGVGLCVFSPTGRYLATRNDNSRSTIWIWLISVRIYLVAVLIHTSGPVHSLAWDPQAPARLALCVGTNNVLMWTPQGCLSVKVSIHASLIYLAHLAHLNSLAFLDFKIYSFDTQLKFV